ncbi:MAG: hypothetical protein E2O39_17545 [Planctomycetota bacterium]|nr:MAG: hypothetical protein E2O39_17545 [Planctomycetota bacterium]
MNLSATSLTLGLALLSAAPVGAGETPARKPNIVLFYVDDLGWSDASFMGSEFYETPHMDQLAAEGMVFTSAYSNGPNCAPSRACLMSGLYPPRHGVYTVGSSKRGKAEDRKLVPTPNETVLADRFVTIAEVLRDAGYATASIGKWHLGADPRTQGFDVNVAGNATGSPRGGYFSPYKNPDLADGPEGEYLTDRLTDEALRFMEEHADGPFFLYLTHYAVHTPIQSKAAERAKYSGKPPDGDQKNAKYAGMIDSADQSLGRVLAKLDELGLADETLVVFTSDNGGHGPVTSMAPLRGAKGMLYEGGIRVPLVVRWPGRVVPGSRSAEPVIGLDLYPTFAEAAGATLPEGMEPDGLSLVPLLTGAGGLARHALYWHFPAYLEAPKQLGRPFRTTPAGAIRMGDFKLIEFFEDGRLELYNVKTDVGETENLIATPIKAYKLHLNLTAWRERVGAPVPVELEPRYVAPIPTELDPLYFAPSGAPRRRADYLAKYALPQAPPASSSERPPNVVLIMADDLGYAEVGCYGQTKIATPNIDRLAAEGVRFTDFYAGAPVCAPSRCVLMTGLHTGHAWVRGNRGKPVVGQVPLPLEAVTVAELLQAAGYTTACIGKWGLGGPNTTGLPNLQGFDRWFGYLDQWNAHDHYPDYLWSDDEKVLLSANADGVDGVHSHDLFTEEALLFLREREPDEPFFLYVPYAIPHVSLQVPEDSLAQYADRWEETPFEGGHYAAHPKPRAAYAAMVTRMDRDVGRILDVLAERGLAENTLVIFTSDNGPSYAGGADSKFFASAGPLRGLKGSLWEGGIRVPFIARWPGRIARGTVSDHVSAFQDVLPTLVELAGGPAPTGIDGVSFAPTLLGRGDQAQHDYLYWEAPVGGWRQAVRKGRWKAVRTNMKQHSPLKLFDLAADIGEEHDISAEHPEIVREMERILASARTESELWPLEVNEDR